MNALYLTLAYLHVFVCVCLVLLVIVQKTTGNGLFTTSQSNPFMSGAEITQFITKLTVFFIILFFINTLVLAKISYTSNSERRNIISASKVEEIEKSVPVLD
jgi:protein translocase SecG subunit